MTKKSINTSYKIMEMLKLLNIKSRSLADFMKCLNFSCSKETISKYLNTIKKAGYRIEKTPEGLYRLLDAPLKINFTKEELITFQKLVEITKKLYQPTLEVCLVSVFQKLECMFSKETKETAKLLRKQTSTLSFNELERKVGEISEMCIDGRKIKFNYRGHFFKVDPIQIEYKNKNIFLRAYNPCDCEQQLFLINDIKNDIQTPQKFSGMKFSKVITFEIKGKLAENYLLHEGERYVENNRDYAIISNNTTEAKLLFKRILRYGDKCRILYPKKEKEEYRKYIEAVLENYN